MTGQPSGRATRKSKSLRAALRSIPKERPGLPASDAVQAVETFISPQNVEYQILRTNEMDTYDEPPEKPKRKRQR